MKTNSSLKNTLLIAGGLYCLCGAPMFAYSQPSPGDGSSIPVQVTNLPVLVKTIVDCYNDIVKMVADMVYEFDTQLSGTVIQNQKIITNQEKAKHDVFEGDVEQAIAFDLSDATKKQEKIKDLGTFSAEDDIITAGSSAPSKFGFQKAPPQIASTSTDKAILNVDALFAHRAYKTEQEKKDALAYITYLENSVTPPPVIRAYDNKIYLPFDPTNQDSIKVIDLSKEDKSKTLEKLATFLDKNPDYKSYRATYRSMIAGKTLYLNNLLRIYQSRLKRDNSGSITKDYTGYSIAELQYNEATKRLQPTYYTAMASASPAVIQRETLFLLAQIHYDLYEMHQDSERLLAMSSIGGLQSNAIPNVMLTQTAKNIGKAIYCDWLLGGKCPASAAGESAPKIDTSDITPKQ